MGLYDEWDDNPAILIQMNHIWLACFWLTPLAQ